MTKANEIILWRHADAEPINGEMDDLERALSEKGKKQAKRMAKWLNQRLYNQALILSSPALRATQTADALDRKYHIEKNIAPTATPRGVFRIMTQHFDTDIKDKQQILLIGHQPYVGKLAAMMLGIGDIDLGIKKGSVWWLRADKDEPLRFKLITVMSPSLL